MLYTITSRIWRRLRPEEGWLSFFLVAAAVAILIAAVLEVDWVPEDAVVALTAPLGLLLGTVLAKRPLGWLPSWSLLLAYGLVITTNRLGRLWPSPSVVLEGWGPSSAHIRQSAGLLADRAGGWFEAVANGDRTEETIVFAFGLGLLAWLLAAFASWSTFRQHRPLSGLTAMGFALALNGFYGDAPLWPATLFSGVAALLAASVHYADLERGWTSRGVDYSSEIRLDLLAAGAGIALLLMSFTFILPSISFRELTRAVLDRPAVHQAEDTLERVFAGVRQPQTRGPVDVVEGQGGIRGAMPRSYLLGNPPELYETVVMTASVGGELPEVTHWRALSYDVYTGVGWSISNERRENLAAGRPLPATAFLEQIALEQKVHWLLGETRNRYTLGQPTSFDQEVTLFWRGLDDLSRIQGAGNKYTAFSQSSVAPATELRQARLEDVPAVILARYGQLPEDVPERVLDLARHVASDGERPSTPYDQAKALEQFLRQYPYSLELNLPPAGADPVDYFLFDLQAGYCDYYASAMVIMARSLGLPARLAAGFLAQKPDEMGHQTIRQIDGHSWAEIYFAGYGWVEFEPTASFPTSDPETPGAFADETGLGELPTEYEPQPIPGAIRRRTLLPWLIVSLGILLSSWWLRRSRLWRREGRPKLDQIQSTYGRLQAGAQRLGQPTPLSQTPFEFEAEFHQRLRKLEKRPLAGHLGIGSLIPEIKVVVNAFTTRQYGPRRPESDPARVSWRRIRVRMWLLAALERLPRFGSKPED